jgi:hypothetical protein
LPTQRTMVGLFYLPCSTHSASGNDMIYLTTSFRTRDSAHSSQTQREIVQQQSTAFSTPLTDQAYSHTLAHPRPPPSDHSTVLFIACLCSFSLLQTFHFDQSFWSTTYDSDYALYCGQEDVS